MTAQPEVPGAAAVYLFKEEVTDDSLNMWSKYVRMKVLTEKGKDYANVELRQYENIEGSGYTVTDITGRTIHSDGTIIPFTGKPFEKLIEKGQGYQEKAKVFTLPDVQVGSIIEYRYKLRYDDGVVIPPMWFVQTELYTRKAHYVWKPTSQTVVMRTASGDETPVLPAWTPILPKGTEVKQTRVASAGDEGTQQLIELNAHDIAPAPDEDHMPPVDSFSYRVLFYYTPYHGVEDFWKNEGNAWAKARDKFIGPGPKVVAAVQGLVTPSDTPEQKLRKIYAAVMKIDNTVFNRSQSATEQRSQGLAPVKSTDDIWERKRGNDDQIAELFVAMARAAGMKAYVMAVTNRDHNLFLPAYLSMNQLDDYIAVVNVDGKDQFFDPGQRYCPYGRVAWKHTRTEGLRQVEGGSALFTTPGEPYTASKTQRIGTLELDEHGIVSGTVTMTWVGAPALGWRQRSLRGDATSFKTDLREAMERLLPSGTEVTVTGVDALEDYDNPLVAHYDIKGPIVAAAGKRMLVPGDIFTMNAKATFPHDKRTLPVYFDYPQMVQDAVRIKMPAGFTVESLPAAAKVPYAKSAFYALQAESSPTSVTVKREFDLGNVIFPAAEYADLRTFYGTLETKDQEPVVLKAAAGGN
jgi:hypothetical protein